ncbi:hypothetical protein N9Y42_00325 [Mariniblastus sp.]|nr:hypothetical protein [Mariniblastus sp.]
MKIALLLILVLAFVAGLTSCRRSSAPGRVASQSESRQELETDADLEHGNRQVVQMLSDRPLMKRFLANDHTQREIKSDSPIWKWVATAYGTRVKNLPIEWDNSKLDKPMSCRADHTIPNDGEKGLIRVRIRFEDGGAIRDAKFEELWSSCVFELFNIQNAEGFMEIYHRALKGKVSRDEWVRENVMLEHGALLKLKEFYDTVWKPWADANGFDADPENWSYSTPQNYDDWMLLYRDSEYSPHDYWEGYYDQRIIPYLKQMREYRNHLRKK